MTNEKEISVELSCIITAIHFSTAQIKKTLLFPTTKKVIYVTCPSVIVNGYQSRDEENQGEEVKHRHNGSL